MSFERLNANMKKLIIISCSIAMIGCAPLTKHKEMAPINVSPIKDPINTSKSLVIDSKKDLLIVYKNGAEPRSNLIKGILVKLDKSVVLHDASLKDLDGLQVDLNKIAVEHNKTVNDYNYQVEKNKSASSNFWHLLWFTVGYVLIGTPILITIGHFFGDAIISIIKKLLKLIAL